MKNHQVAFVEYTEEFLDLSWEWLNDPEIKLLTMTPDFSREDQRAFFFKLPRRSDYKIFGIVVDGEKSGACGLKNIQNGEAELWCYLGLRKYWGAGIGRIIVEYIEQESKRFNVSRLYLKVAKSNLRAIKAYEKSGFIVTSENSAFFVMAKGQSQVGAK